MEQKQIDNRVILEELNRLRQEVEEMKAFMNKDMEFAKRVDEAWESYDRGEFIGMEKEEFLKELEKW